MEADAVPVRTASDECVPPMGKNSFSRKKRGQFFYKREQFVSRLGAYFRRSVKVLNPSKIIGLLRPTAIWTDGSYDRQTGLGGWAVVIEHPELKQTFKGAVPATKSQNMELIAAAKGLESIDKPSRVSIYTDSSSIRKVAHSYSRKYAKRADSELVQRLYAAIDYHSSVTVCPLRAHTGIEKNEIVDRLAKSAVREGAIDFNIPLRETFGLIPKGQKLPGFGLGAQ